MQWALDNWIWILLGGGFLALHLFGHGGHGGHGKKGRDGASSVAPKSRPTPPAADGTEK